MNYKSLGLVLMLSGILTLSTTSIMGSDACCATTCCSSACCYSSDSETVYRNPRRHSLTRCHSDSELNFRCELEGSNRFSSCFNPTLSKLGGSSSNISEYSYNSNESYPEISCTTSCCCECDTRCCEESCCSHGCCSTSFLDEQEETRKRVRRKQKRLAREGKIRRKRIIEARKQATMNAETRKKQLLQKRIRKIKERRAGIAARKIQAASQKKR